MYSFVMQLKWNMNVSARFYFTYSVTLIYIEMYHGIRSEYPLFVCRKKRQIGVIGWTRP